MPKGRRETHYASSQGAAPSGTPGPAASEGADPGASGAAGAGTEPMSAEETLRRATRAQNRAAKRATNPRPRPRPQQRRSNAGLIGVLAAAVVIGVAAIALANPFGSPAASATPRPSGTTAVSPYGDGTCPTKQPAVLPVGQKRTVTIETSLGKMILEIDGSLAPIAAGNFIALAECEYYDGIVFHRTAALGDGTPFVIQGGDPDGNGTGGPGYTIADEQVKTTYRRGTVAMARSSAPNSQGSQFFIVLDDKAVGPLAQVNTYAIFGSVISGMDVADAIFQASNGSETPADPIEMISVTVAGGPAASPTTAPSVTAAPATTAPSASQ